MASVPAAEAARPRISSRMSLAPSRSSRAARSAPARAASASDRMTVRLAARHEPAPVGRGDHPGQVQCGIRPRAERANRRLAPAFDTCQQRPLGARGQTRRGVVDRPQQGKHPAIVRARFDRESALPWRGQHDVRLDDLGGSAASSPSRSKPARASTSASYSPRSSLASRVGTLPLMSSIDRCGWRASNCERLRIEDVPMRAPGGRCSSRLPGGGHQDVTRIGALQHRRQRQAVGQARGQVLEAVHRDVDRALQQRRPRSRA